MSKQRGRRVPDGVLAGHYQIGRRFVPEIIAKVDPEFSDWIKTDLPDLLWPMILVHIYGYKGIVSLRIAQEDVFSHIRALPNETHSNILDGRLTSLGQVRGSDREGIIRTLRQASYRDQLFSPEIKGILSLLRLCPWILAAREPWNHRDIPSEDESRILLGDAIFEVITDGHANALTKVSNSNLAYDHRTFEYATKAHRRARSVSEQLRNATKNRRSNTKLLRGH